MIPKLNRGYSFKGLTRYLTHDKRPEGANDNGPHPLTAERVGFTRTLNFVGEAAKDNPAIAACIMAETWQAREALKVAAGIKPGGTTAEAPPVWHSSLSWAKGEAVTPAEMMRAAQSYLEAQGLGLEKGYQTYLLQHTDTAQPHVHIVVNLVHPETGKQANPFRDKQKAQAWARDYERQRGTIYCHDREAKYAAIDRARPSHATPTRAAFNDNSRGAARAEAPPAPDRFGRSRERTREPREARQPRQPRKGQSRSEWQARQGKAQEAQEAADRIKADTAAQWSALKAAEKAAFAQRSAEAARFHADRKAGREAIIEKYQSALDGIRKPQGGPKSASPDRRKAWLSIHQQQEARRKAFEANEGSALGRVRNALELGKGAGFAQAARLAVSATERRRVFESGQRAIVARVLPREERRPERPRPKTPEPKRVQMERVKAMRAKELAAYTRETLTKAAAMKARHAFQRQGEKDARAMLSKEIGTAWRQHRATYGKQAEARTQGKEGGVDRQPEAKTDRFGRSRDRDRQDRAAETGSPGRIDAEAERLAWIARLNAEEARQEALAREYGQDQGHDPGREMSR